MRRRVPPWPLPGPHWLRPELRDGLLVANIAGLPPWEPAWAGVVRPDARPPSEWDRSRLDPGPDGHGHVVARRAATPGGGGELAWLIAPGDVVEFGARQPSRVLRRRRSEEMGPSCYAPVLETGVTRLVLGGPYASIAPALALGRLTSPSRRVAAGAAGGADPVAPAAGGPAPSGSVVRVLDAARGTIEAERGAVVAALRLSPGELADLIASSSGARPRADEPTITLAALAARDAPERLPTDHPSTFGAGRWPAAAGSGPDEPGAGL